MVEQQQKSVRSVGGNSPVRSAKIFKFRRFRCKNAHDSLQTYPGREDDTCSVQNAVFLFMELPCIEFFLVAQLRKIFQKRTMLAQALCSKSNELHFLQLFSYRHGFISTINEKKVNKQRLNVQIFETCLGMSMVSLSFMYSLQYKKESFSCFLGELCVGLSKQ